MNWKENYKPGPVDIEDVIDAEVSLSFSSDTKEADGKAVADFVTEITALIKKVSLSGQTLKLPADLCTYGNFDEAEIGRFIRSRVDLYFNPPEDDVELDETAERAKVWEARVDLVFQQFGSVKIHIDDPEYKGAFDIYIDDLKAVVRVLGTEPKKGDLIKVTNVRHVASTKTKGPKGRRTWSNQTIADICERQS